MSSVPGVESLYVDRVLLKLNAVGVIDLIAGHGSFVSRYVLMI